MKKLFFLFAFMGLFAFGVSAQKKACCASKNASSSKSCSAMVDKAASADKNIVKQVSNTGDINYVRKEVDSTNGKVMLTSVEYCTKSGKFVNVSPTDGMKTSCTKKGVATKVSSTDKKACCEKGKEKACCAKGEMKSCHGKGEKASKSAKVSKEAKVKLVSNTNDQ